MWLRFATAACAGTTAASHIMIARTTPNNRQGFAQGVLNSAAERIRDVAGDGYTVEAAHPISFVAIASVRTGDFKSRLDNSRNNTLLKAAGSVKI